MRNVLARMVIPAGAVLAVLLSTASVASASVGTDPFDELLDRYVRETRELVSASATESERSAFHRRWLDTMLKALASRSAESAGRTGAIGVALSLANTLEELDQAETLAADLRTAVRDSPGSRLWAIRVQAELALARGHRESNRGHFTRARDFLNMAIKESAPPAWPELARTRHLEERLVCLDLLGRCHDELGDFRASASAFARGAEEAPRIREFIGSNEQWRLGVEYFAQQAASAAARSRDLQGVRENLDRIAALPESRVPPSVHVDRAGRLLGDDEAYISLARSWLSAHPRDARTVVLEFGLARALGRSGEADAELAILERIHAEHITEVIAVDRGDAHGRVRAPSGSAVGFAELVLWEYGRALHLAGRFGEAVVIHEQLLREHPTSPLRQRVVSPGGSAR